MNSDELPIEEPTPEELEDFPEVDFRGAKPNPYIGHIDWSKPPKVLNVDPREKPIEQLEPITEMRPMVCGSAG